MPIQKGSAPTSRPLRRRVLYMMIVVVCTVAALEVVSLGLHPLLLGRAFSPRAFAEARRLADQRTPRDRDASPRSERFLAEDVLHPYLGFVGNPTVDAGFSNLGFWGPLGWPPPRRDASRLLVGIVGGSFAGELAINAGEHLRTRLSAIRRFADREIVILNMSHGGWKQPQQLLALTWILALGGELDLLLNVDGFNEVALDGTENAVRGVFPAFPRSWALRVDDFSDPDQARRLAVVALRLEQRAAAAEFFDRAPLGLSPTANLLWALLDRRSSRQLSEARLALARERPSHDGFRQTGPPERMDPQQRMNILVGVWQRSSVELSRIAAANGIEYFHFLQPNQYDDGAKLLSQEERGVAFRDDHPYRSGARTGYPLLRAAGQTLRREGDFFHDFSRLFEAVDAPLFADDCCHLSKDGYRRVADAISEVVAARVD